MAASSRPARLAADDVVSDDDIARFVSTSGSTVYRTKRHFEGNLELALNEESRPGAARSSLSSRRRFALSSRATPRNATVLRVAEHRPEAKDASRSVAAYFGPKLPIASSPEGSAGFHGRSGSAR